MKTLTFILISFFLLPQEGKKPKSDAETSHLIGKVKSIIETEYDANMVAGKVQKSFSGKSLIRYNENGYETKSINYDKPNIVYSTDSSLDNDKGLLTEMDSYLGDGSPNGKVLYQYDENGNETEANGFNADGSVEYNTTFKYDKAGNQIEVLETKPGDVAPFNLKNTYDEKGNKVEENQLNKDGSLKGKETWKYDEKGNRVENKSYDADGSLIFNYAYKYDDKGNKIEFDWLNTDGSLKAKTVFRFDDKNNEIESKDFDADGKLTETITTKYIYDVTGNVIKKSTFSNDKETHFIDRPMEITEMVIQYY